MQIAIAVMQNLYKLLLLPCYPYPKCTEAGFATSTIVQRPVHTRGYTDDRFITHAVFRSASKSEHHRALLTVPIQSIDNQEPLLPKNAIAHYALYGSASPAVTLEPCFYEIVITSVGLHLNPVSPTRPAPDAVVKI